MYSVLCVRVKCEGRERELRTKNNRSVFSAAALPRLVARWARRGDGRPKPLSFNSEQLAVAVGRNKQPAEQSRVEQPQGFLDKLAEGRPIGKRKPTKDDKKLTHTDKKDCNQVG